MGIKEGRKMGRHNRIIGSIALVSLMASQLGACAHEAKSADIKSGTSEEIDVSKFECPKPKESEDSYQYKRMAPMVGMPSPMPMPSVAAMPAPPTPPSAAMVQNNIIITGSRAVNGQIIPQTQDTEKYPNAAINSVKRVAEEATSTFAMEVDTASYTNARRFINEDDRLPPSDAVRVEEFLNYFKYDYSKSHDKNIPFATDVAVAPSPWNGDKQIIHIGVNGYEANSDKRPPLNLVLLLDVSGSMYSEDKLPLAKKAIYTMLPQLTAEDKVSVVVYAGASGTLLEPTKGSDTRTIVCALEGLEAGGSTAGAEGIELAYKLAEKNFKKDAVNRVVLMTDGDFNVGITDPRKLKDFVTEKKDKGIYLSVFGFGRGNYNDDMMQQLAQNGNGIAAYLDSLSEAKRVLRDDFQGNMFPIANDVKAQVEFNPAYVSEWRLIGYETRKLNREDFNNDKVDAGEIGKGHQVTAIYEITPVGGKSSFDPLRYQKENATKPNKNGEIAYLRLRYKLPGESTSKLTERAITYKDAYENLDDAPDKTRFALAVAAFGQKLRGDPWIGNYSYDNIAALANGAKANDTYGYKGEFIKLVEKAKTLSHLNENKDK
jgi:Ca-activated chloride channel family protein